jgi:hypothetical protein
LQRGPRDTIADTEIDRHIVDQRQMSSNRPATKPANINPETVPDTFSVTFSLFGPFWTPGTRGQEITPTRSVGVEDGRAL